MNILSREESYALKLRELYHSHNYNFYRMSRFEEYDFYVGKKDFLTSAAILTFTDINGRLMALRPDVTLSIIKHAPSGKYFYDEKVYRPKNSDTFREIPQCGIECTGLYDFNEILQLALLSLRTVADGRNYALDVADAGKIAKIIPQDRKHEILHCLASKNIHGLKDIHAPDEIIALAEVSKNFHGLDNVRVDYSAVTNLSYYVGFVMKGYVDGSPEAVLSGGEYSVDGINGAGFAVYLDTVTGGGIND